jgi:predicted TIM-barrel fold metal-dependent hydrolase
MKIIDCHAHYEPGLLDVKSILKRMEKHSIDQTFLMSAMTTPPIYNKSSYLMAVQRFILNSNYFWPIAKKLDDGFHSSPGEWDPWYRKLIGKKEKYEIIQNPDNEAVFKAVEQQPEKLKGWIFLNPKINKWEMELQRWKQHPGAIGLKIHPFWHRYLIKEAKEIANKAEEYNFPLMIHMGFENIKDISKFIRDLPNLKIIFSHAAFPYYSKIWPEIKNNPNKYVDLSSHHIDRRIVARTVSFLGPDRCVYGTDDPYGDEEAGKLIQKWINLLDINDKGKEKIFSKNISNLINIMNNS